jgi:two-component system, chemotaxis family, protein-glutamate methylesterase/glutaminase
MRLKVLVVDDSALYRQLVKNVLRGLPNVDVVGLACTGKEALMQIPELKPDFLTLDVQMPDMNGLELLREIKKRRMSVKAIMLSSLTAHGAQETTDALLAGAFDFIQKPNNPDPVTNRTILAALLNEKIDALRESLHATMPIRKSGSASVGIAELCGETIARCAKLIDPKDTASQPKRGSKRIHAVVVGTSTGGPVALREVIPKLPATLGVPVFVVQHMPPNYTKSLALRIGENSQLPVHEASHGLLVEPNNVYIAPGGLHMGVASQRGKLFIQTSDAPPEHNCRPSVDYTLRSIADAYAGNVLVVILTGMGRDGTEGCRRIKQLGGTILAQHPEGCVVYGMPKAVVEEQLVDRVVPLEKMASWIVRMIEAC